MPGPHPEFLPAGELIYLDDLHLFVRFRIGAFLGFILYLQADRGGVGYVFGSQAIFFPMYFWRFRMCACFVAKQLFQVCLPERVAFDQCLYRSAIRSDSDYCVAYRFLNSYAICGELRTDGCPGTFTTCQKQ